MNFHQKWCISLIYGLGLLKLNFLKLIPKSFTLYFMRIDYSQHCSDFPTYSNFQAYLEKLDNIKMIFVVYLYHFINLLQGYAMLLPRRLIPTYSIKERERSTVDFFSKSATIWSRLPQMLP